MGQRVDLWSDIIRSDEEDGDGFRDVPQVEVYQRRKKLEKPSAAENLNRAWSVKGVRTSFINGPKRDSWTRSLSTRGRESIAVGAYVNNQPQKKHVRRKKPAIPKGKGVKAPDLQKEKEYFHEVDAFELVEESPSPKTKNASTWINGEQVVPEVPHLATRLEKWLISKKLNRPCGPSSTLSKILESSHSTTRLEPILDDVAFDVLALGTPANASASNSSIFRLIQSGDDSLDAEDVPVTKIKTEEIDFEDESVRKIKTEEIDLEDELKRLSLTSDLASSHLDYEKPFLDLLSACGQMRPSNFMEVFSKFCEPESIVKIGEGTYGEAFRAGPSVCKIVPIDGDFTVNGEIQKRADELLEEVILSWTLNQLREQETEAQNLCPTFIRTQDIKVCQGPYDPILVKAWEEWDAKNGSENDHPDFPEKQCYVMFVLEHGGKDLEGFVLLNFDEARSLLVQVTAGLAVAEAAFEFEHRDLHWGNILLSRNNSSTLPFIVEGKQVFVKTFGVQISIIDFTLSRINTGEKILFLDLTADPYLFKGPKGDKQSETYRKMKAVTKDSWEGHFARTNVLWLIYLVDLLLTKKSFERSSKDERELRSLKQRMEKYKSAKEALSDPFFSDMLLDQIS
ncbi:serine/threonine-protein kinase haspin homolog isoform X3 [Brassica napus]|uniref:serine/threonine-protein kinase haspin homolog isoform X3 n=1 Tax=Brassica napus TaxID=3708 RepID=UPI0006AA82FD|nr:serine/threonine-protein kinase haspin homolog isoform X3 [Brassica napus]